jgi:hypothetical protein
MDVYRPLRTALFIYECVRLLLLVGFLCFAPPGSAENGISFPYLAFLSSNVLFPLMALFVWLRPGEYSNYLTLHIAGKIVTVVLFYVWEFISFRQVFENLIRSLILLGGCAFISFVDILSVWGAWVLKNKFRALVRTSGQNNLPEYGGI